MNKNLLEGLKGSVGRLINRCEQVYKEVWACRKERHVRKFKPQTLVQSRIFTNPWKAFKIKAFYHQTILTTPPHLV